MFETIHEVQVFIGADGKVRKRGDLSLDRRVPPCSTFKLLLALEGLNSGVLPGIETLRRFTGKKSGRPEWDRDLTLRTALKASAEWYFQEVARQIGPGRLRATVQKLGYGSGWSGSDPALAWHDGSLTISPTEQARFVRALVDGKTPYPAATIAAVRDCLVVDKAGAATLWGKTGTGTDIAWFVGAVTIGGKTTAFAVHQAGEKVLGPRVRERVRRQAVAGQFPPR